MSRVGDTGSGRPGPGAADARRAAATGLSGRVRSGPSALLHEEVLRPQFDRESRHLLGWYVLVEKVLVAEYLRLGLLDGAQARAVAALLDSAPAAVAADPAGNLSDLAFALERHVEAGLPAPAPLWHVDRSRNDLQSCAQLLFGRARVLDVVGGLLALADGARRFAHAHLRTPMPGQTHYQPAQVITPGFYFAAFGEQLLHSAQRLLDTYDGMDSCPLGAGAVAGQHLPWDRARMAGLLGFAAANPNALAAVASRAWVAEVTAELSLFGAALSRFVTDLIDWTSGAQHLVELPDELSGISSAMPQKKNYPVLERIRGRTAHLSAAHVDVLLGQRNTPYTNLVEVSKEAGAGLYAAFDTAESVLRLTAAVLGGLRVLPERMRAACEREYLGGFALATQLTLRDGVPWRRAQVLAGAYVLAALATGRAPAEVDPDLLVRLAADEGHRIGDPEGLLTAAFDVDAALYDKPTAGSVHPDAVAAELAAQVARRDGLGARRDLLRARTAGAAGRIAAALG